MTNNNTSNNSLENITPEHWDASAVEMHSTVKEQLGCTWREYLQWVDAWEEFHASVAWEHFAPFFTERIVSATIAAAGIKNLVCNNTPYIYTANSRLSLDKEEGGIEVQRRLSNDSGWEWESTSIVRSFEDLEKFCEELFFVERLA